MRVSQSIVIRRSAPICSSHSRHRKPHLRVWSLDLSSLEFPNSEICNELHPDQHVSKWGLRFASLKNARFHSIGCCSESRQITSSLTKDSPAPPIAILAPDLCREGSEQPSTSSNNFGILWIEEFLNWVVGRLGLDAMPGIFRNFHNTLLHDLSPCNSYLHFKLAQQSQGLSVDGTSLH